MSVRFPSVRAEVFAVAVTVGVRVKLLWKELLMLKSMSMATGVPLVSINGNGDEVTLEEDWFNDGENWQVVLAAHDVVPSVIAAPELLNIVAEGCENVTVMPVYVPGGIFVETRSSRCVIKSDRLTVTGLGRTFTEPVVPEPVWSDTPVICIWKFRTDAPAGRS